jgi:hypothetical protein
MKRMRLLSVVMAGAAALSGAVFGAVFAGGAAEAATCTVGPNNSITNSTGQGYILDVRVYHLRNCSSYTTLHSGQDTYHNLGWSQVGAVYTTYNRCAELGYKDSAGKYHFVKIMQGNQVVSLPLSVNYIVAPYPC